MYPNTHPEQIVDKNGVLTTRHKRNSAVSSSRELPNVPASQRTAGATLAQRATFDAACVLIREMIPGAKKVSVDEIDGRLVLIAIDGDYVEPTYQTFLMEKALERGSLTPGTYSIPTTLDENKIRDQYVKHVYDRTVMSEERMTEGGQSMLAGLVAITEVTEENSVEDNYIFAQSSNPLTRSILAMNPEIQQEVLNSLADDPDVSTRGEVAQRSEDPEIVNKLARDENHTVRFYAVRSNPLVTQENVVWNYYNTPYASSYAVGRRDAPREIVQHAYENSWDYRALNHASAKEAIDNGPLWGNDTKPGFHKEAELDKVTNKAAAWVSHKVHGTGREVEEVYLTDEEARSVAWRIATRGRKNENEAFIAFNEGKPFSLNKLAAEAASLLDARFSDRTYGLKWNADSYANSIIGWVRNKQQQS